MRLLNVLNAPWAIVPDQYAQVRDIYLRHLGGEKISEDTIKAIEASSGRPLENQEQGYEVVNGAALIPLSGVIAAKMNLFTRISGGCSVELLARDFRQALADSTISKIIFVADTPGGVVAGIQDFAAEIFAARGIKPIIAWTDNQICSAGYWLMAATDGIYISNDTTQVGSIGVITSHTDISKQEAMLGVKTTPIYAGKYKAVGNKHEPLSEEGKAAIQEPIDYIYSVFVGDVAKYRGISEKDALSMADGKVYIGKQALTAGLVDGVSTLDALIAGEVSIAPARVAAATTIIPARAAGETTTNKEDVMNKEEIKAKFPDAYKAIFAEGAAQGAADTMPTEDCNQKQEEVKKESAQAASDRIKAVYELGKKMPGHTALIEGFMFDGKTTGPVAAMAIIEAEGGKRSAMASAIEADAAAITVPAAGAPNEQGKKGFMAVVEEHMTSTKVSKGQAISAMAKAHPELHAEYLAQQKPGKAS